MPKPSKIEGHSIIRVHHGQPFTTTLAVAAGVGMEHASVRTFKIRLVKAFRSAINELNRIRSNRADPAWHQSRIVQKAARRYQLLYGGIEAQRRQDSARPKQQGSAEDPAAMGGRGQAKRAQKDQWRPVVTKDEIYDRAIDGFAASIPAMLRMGETAEEIRDYFIFIGEEVIGVTRAQAEGLCHDILARFAACYATNDSINAVLSRPPTS